MYDCVELKRNPRAEVKVKVIYLTELNTFNSLRFVPAKRMLRIAIPLNFEFHLILNQAENFARY